MRHFQTKMEEEVGRYQRYGECFAVLVLDIDHFKEVNDRCGHPAGHQVLRGVAERIRAACRLPDVACRYGGEEFSVILPHTIATGARAVARRMWASIAAAPFDLDAGSRISVTVSIGIAACPRDAADVRGLVTAADRTMYRAKEVGRNRVCDATDGLSD